MLIQTTQFTHTTSKQLSPIFTISSHRLTKKYECIYSSKQKKKDEKYFVFVTGGYDGMMIVWIGITKKIELLNENKPTVQNKKPTNIAEEKSENKNKEETKNENHIIDKQNIDEKVTQTDTKDSAQNELKNDQNNDKNNELKSDLNNDKNNVNNNTKNDNKNNDDQSSKFKKAKNPLALFPIQSLNEHKSAVLCTAITQVNQTLFLISGSDDCSVVVWQFKKLTEKEKKTIQSESNTTDVNISNSSLPQNTDKSANKKTEPKSKKKELKLTPYPYAFVKTSSAILHKADIVCISVLNLFNVFLVTGSLDGTVCLVNPSLVILRRIKIDEGVKGLVTYYNSYNNVFLYVKTDQNLHVYSIDSSLQINKIRSVFITDLLFESFFSKMIIISTQDCDEKSTDLLVVPGWLNNKADTVCLLHLSDLNDPDIDETKLRSRATHLVTNCAVEVVAWYKDKLVTAHQDGNIAFWGWGNDENEQNEEKFTEMNEDEKTTEKVGEFDSQKLLSTSESQKSNEISRQNHDSTRVPNFSINDSGCNQIQDYPRNRNLPSPSMQNLGTNLQINKNIFNEQADSHTRRKRNSAPVSNHENKKMKIFFTEYIPEPEREERRRINNTRDFLDHKKHDHSEFRPRSNSMPRQAQSILEPQDKYRKMLYDIPERNTEPTNIPNRIHRSDENNSQMKSEKNHTFNNPAERLSKDLKTLENSLNFKGEKPSDISIKTDNTINSNQKISDDKISAENAKIDHFIALLDRNEPIELKKQNASPQTEPNTEKNDQKEEDLILFPRLQDEQENSAPHIRVIQAQDTEDQKIESKLENEEEKTEKQSGGGDDDIDEIKNEETSSKDGMTISSDRIQPIHLNGTVQTPQMQSAALNETTSQIKETIALETPSAFKLLQENNTPQTNTPPLHSDPVQPHQAKPKRLRKKRTPKTAILTDNNQLEETQSQPIPKKRGRKKKSESSTSSLNTFIQKKTPNQKDQECAQSNTENAARGDISASNTNRNPSEITSFQKNLNENVSKKFHKSPNICPKIYRDKRQMKKKVLKPTAPRPKKTPITYRTVPRVIHQPVLLLKSVSTLPFVHIEPIVHCYEVNQPQSQKTNDPDDNSSEDTKSITNAVPQDGSLLLASYDGTVTLLALDELTVQEKNKKETVERMMTDSKKYKEQDKIEIVESHKIEDQNNKNSNQEQMKEKQEITDSTSKEGFKNLIELEKNEENLSDAATAVNETKMGSKLNDLIEDNKINQKDERRVAEEISQKQLEATSPTNETFQIPNEDSGPRKKRRIIPVRIDPVPSELPKKEETQIVEQKVRISMKPRLLNPHSLTFKKIRISVDSTSVQTTNSCVRKSKEFTGYFSPLCNCANKNTQTQQLKNQNTDESSDTIFLVTVSNADAFLYSFEVCNLSGLYFNEERLVLVHFLINEKNEFLRLLTVKDTLTGSTKIPPFTFSTLNVSLYRKTALLLGPTEFKVIGRKIWSGPVPEGNWNCRIIKRNISLRSFNCCQNTKKVNLTYNSKLGSFLIEQFNSLERIEKMIFEGVSARKVYKKIREYIKKGLNVEESKDKLKVERSNDLAEVSKRNTEEVKEEIETKRNTAEGLRGFISQRNRKDGNSTVDVRKEDRHNLPDKRLTIPQQTLYRLKPAILYVLTQQDTVTRLDMIYLLECEKDRLGEWFVDGVVRESRSSNGSP